MLLLLLFSILAATILAQTPCAPRVYRGPDNPTTCVCNATYCDTITPLGILASNQIAVYTSSQSGKRFERTTLNFGSSSAASIQIRVNTNQKNQTIFGFGGAFTDSMGSNLIRLSQEARNNLIRAYFAPEGIGYTVGRTPIGSADYSLAPYSYDDTQGDFNLTNFKLNTEDFEYRIPFIQQAIQLTQGKIRLYASPWSAPGWMKVTGKTGTGGALIGEVNGQYYQTWANYIVRFFEEYNKNNITFWGVTMENEPIEGGWPNYKWNAMYFNSTMERDFAKGVWGQTLRNNPLTKNLKLMVMDDQRQYLEQFADDVLGDPDANKVVDGVALHWYGDGNTSPSLLTKIHEKFPDKFLLYTEACILSPPVLGSWADGDSYMHYIINILNNWVIGFVDWNMALNPQGGPSWMGNSYGSPIIVSNTVDEFEKNPTFYAMGHLAKFIVPDSVIVGLNIANLPANLDAVAALTPSGQKVIVLDNRDVAANYTVSVYNDQGSYVNLNLEARSFTTLVFN